MPLKKILDRVSKKGRVIGIKLPKLPRNSFTKQRQYNYDLIHSEREGIHLEVTKHGPNHGCIMIKPKSNKFSKISKVHFEIKHTKNGKHLFLSDLSTTNAYRSEKFVKQIFAEIETIAKEQGANKLALSVFIDNPRAISIYKKYGFRIVKTNTHQKYPTHRMEKLLE